MGETAQCHNLAEGLLPVAVQWFRATATPATLCASAGVCGAALAAEPRLNQVRPGHPAGTATLARLEPHLQDLLWEGSRLWGTLPAGQATPAWVSRAAIQRGCSVQPHFCKAERAAQLASPPALLAAWRSSNACPAPL
jgi:hypothetical protein